MPRTAPATARALIPGKYNVYAPAKKSYAAFNTLKEAQAAVTAQKTGVILDPKGVLNPAQQKWSGWSRYQSTFPAAPVVLNPGAKPGAHVTARGANANGPIAVTHSATSPGKGGKAAAPSFTAAPKPGAFHVFVPLDMLTDVGLENHKPPFNNGAFLAFATESEAQAEALRLGFGVVMMPQGAPSATQTWLNAQLFGSQADNVRLKPQRVAGQVNVWFPAADVDNLGVGDSKPYPKGAYLAFASTQEAKDHVQSRGFGVILNTKGALNPADQVWDGAGEFIARDLNAQMTAKPAANQVNVWFPGDLAETLGLKDPKPFAQGAYLAFPSVAEAQAHVQQRGVGVVLGPKGQAEAVQPWRAAPSYVAQLLNAKASPAPVANQVNVWFPPQLTLALGLKDPAPFATKGAYLGFDSLADAKAHVVARGKGVVLGPKGEFEEANQAWTGANPAMASLLNPQLTPTRTPGQVSVWFTRNALSYLGTLDTPSRFNTDGAYLAFDSLAAAQAHVKQRRAGVIVDPQGHIDAAAQVWDGALKIAAEQLNSKLTAAPTAQKINVWFPPEALPGLSLTDAKPFKKDGAYLAFDSLDAAKLQVKGRRFGVIFGAKGEFDASVQVWDQAGPSVARLKHAQLASTATANTVNVWTPPSSLYDLSLSKPEPFRATGTYLAFDSVADAQAHVRLQGFGVIFGPKGDIEPSAQVWEKAISAGAQRLNPQLKEAPTPHTFNVLFPTDHLEQLGLEDVSPFRKRGAKGAYLSFPTLEAAKDHVRDRTFGVLLDQQGKYLQDEQVWRIAARYGPPRDAWPPPKVAPEVQVAKENDSDILGVYAQATKTGAKVAIRTHNSKAGEVLAYDLYVNALGAEVKLKDLGKQTLPPGVFVHDGVFEFDYGPINDVLDLLQQGLKVKSGETAFSVKVTWPGGHNQGSGGGGGAGNHRFVAP